MTQLPEWVPNRANGTRAAELVVPVANDDNAVVVKSPNAEWGNPATIPYGKGQAFMLLKEDTTGAVEPDDLVLFRIDRRGAIGSAGGLHVATGLRKRAGDVFTESIWIDPSDDTVGLVIDAANNAPAQSFLIARLNNGTLKASITKDGAFVSEAGDVVARNADAAGRVLAGQIFGVPGVLFGTDTSTFIAREATGVVSIFDAVQLREVADPAAPPANKGRVYIRDNGAGKSQLCARFPTGAVQVIATEP